VLFFPQQKFRKNISTSYICPNGKWVKPVPSSLIISIYVSAQKFNLFEEQQELKESVRRLKTTKKTLALAKQNSLSTNQIKIN